jgi:hypothetical protein
MNLNEHHETELPKAGVVATGLKINSMREAALQTNGNIIGGKQNQEKE